MIQIVKYQKIWLSFSTILVTASIAAIIFVGFNLGIDFEGGSLLEISFEKNDIQSSDIVKVFSENGINDATIQKTSEKSFLIRSCELKSENKNKIIKSIQEKFGQVEEKRFESIGPIIGSELKRKAIISIIIASVAIILYLAWAFRRASETISSWKMGVAAVVALIHDILIICGVFVFLGKYFNVAIDAYFVTALLTVLGFSVHDTIVVFDRIRENLYKSGHDESFENIVNRGINETIARSLNTSLTILFALLAVILFGGETTRFFVLALTLGIIVGTYSSIFVASPILVIWHRRSKA